MKRKLLTIALALAFSIAAWSQESIFQNGDKVVNFGIGFGSTLYSGSFYNSSVPPLSASFEMGIQDGILEKGVLGVGGYLGYSAYKWENTYLGGAYGWKYSNIILGARGVFHYPLVDELDTYTGLLLGVQIISSKETGDFPSGINYNSQSGGLTAAWFAGARYYFSDNFGAFLELGYGISYLTLGVSLQL